MRRTWGFVVGAMVVALAALLLVGCGQASTTGSASGKKQVLCTTFPQYDWARQIIGDDANIELSLLLDDGVDLHSYQPTVEDIAKVGSCDLFVYVGGESDAWVADALANATNKNLKSINMLETLGDRARTEEVVEGMQVDHEAGHDADHDAAPAYDEHVWLSVRNASLYVDTLEAALAELDPDHAQDFHANADAYRAKLSELDAKYQAMVDAAPKKTILFGDRFPFRYLVDDYHISYYAAFEGCSAETEASFETIVFLAGKVDELGLGTVLVIDGSDQRIAQTIIQNTKTKDQQIRAVDSLQSVSAADAKDRTYLGAMESNLEVLAQAMA